MAKAEVEKRTRSGPSSPVFVAETHERLSYSYLLLFNSVRSLFGPPGDKTIPTVVTPEEDLILKLPRLGDNMNSKSAWRKGLANQSIGMNIIFYLFGEVAEVSRSKGGLSHEV